MKASFGHSLAIRGDRIVVGASRKDVGGIGFDAGKAYVFERDANSTPIWQQAPGSPLTAFGACQAPANRFNDPCGSSTDCAAQGGSCVSPSGAAFGQSVALDGIRIAAGAADYGDAAHAGAAYVFVLDSAGTPLDPSDDVWIPEKRLTPSDSHAGQFFGWDVSLAEGSAVVTATDDAPAGSHSGSAYVFDRAGADWTQRAKLTASCPWEGEDFGSSVSMSGDFVLVGAELEAQSSLQSGAAYFFSLAQAPPCVDPSDTDGDGIADKDDNCCERPNAPQRDTDLDDFGNACDGDFDGNGTVGLADFGIFKNAFSGSAPNIDTDCDDDEITGIADFGCFKSGFGLPVGPRGKCLWPGIATSDADCASP